jgi:acyl-CoA synthetase (AMP-forming)/AMP-acid ligase II
MNEDRNLGELLERRAADSGDAIYLYWKDEEVSYAAFDRRVNRVANGLRDLGAGAGQKAALLLRNCPEFLYAFFACAKLGALAVPINPQLKSDELHYILDNSEAVLRRRRRPPRPTRLRELLGAAGHPPG